MYSADAIREHCKVLELDEFGLTKSEMIYRLIVSEAPLPRLPYKQTKSEPQMSKTEGTIVQVSRGWSPDGASRSLNRPAVMQEVGGMPYISQQPAEVNIGGLL